MKVMHGQNARRARLQPAVLRQRLALGTVSIAAGVILGLLVTAPVALLEVTSKRSGAACGHGVKHLPLLSGQGLRPEFFGVVSNDLRHLMRRAL